MSEEAKGGAPKKLSTAEILAMARAKAGAAASPPKQEAPAGEAAAPAPATSAAPAAETPVAPAAPKPAAGKPKSTADILAAARAAKGGGAGPVPAEDKPAPKPAAAPAAGGARPKSTADILAAARAKAGVAPAAASSGEAAPPPGVGAKPAVAAAAGAATGMSVQQMLAAMRPASESTSGPNAGVSEKEKPAPAVAPPMPAKPLPAKKPGAKASAETSRRGFLIAALVSFWVVAWTSFVAACSVGALGVLRFMLPNVLTEPPRKFKIGTPDDYDLGTVATKWVAQYGVWVVHTDQYKGNNLIYALISVCTHLGCTPSWLEGEQKFKCPCHGSGFYITGMNFEGPAPRPLERAGIRIAEDGMLEVDKSLKFQEEMGQWSDPSSFVAIS